MIEAALVSCDDHLDLNMLPADLWQGRMSVTGPNTTCAQTWSRSMSCSRSCGLPARSSVVSSIPPRS